MTTVYKHIKNISSKDRTKSSQIHKSSTDRTKKWSPRETEIKMALNIDIILVSEERTEPVLLLKTDQEETWQIFIYAVCYAVTFNFYNTQVTADDRSHRMPFATRTTNCTDHYCSEIPGTG